MGTKGLRRDAAGEALSGGASRDGAGANHTGPPFVVVGTGICSLLTSLLLAVVGGGSAVHLLGYLTGAVIPVLVFGIARRLDLDRRTDPAYRSAPLFRTLLTTLGAGAVLTAGLHIWPLATGWAS